MFNKTNSVVDDDDADDAHAVDKIDRTKQKHE